MMQSAKDATQYMFEITMYFPCFAFQLIVERGYSYKTLYLVLKTPPRVKANTVPVPQWLLQSQRIHEGKTETEMVKTVRGKKAKKALYTSWGSMSFQLQLQLLYT
jgi:hypothetical protein